MFITEPIEPSDVDGGFSCGVAELDDYFSLQALVDDENGTSHSYVLRFSPDQSEAAPFVLGFYTLSYALVESQATSKVVEPALPSESPLVAVISMLAVDKRASGRHLGETLLIDALRRVVYAASILRCQGVVVFARDEAAKSFFANCDFVTVTHEDWPRRMFLPIALARGALTSE